MAFAARQVLLAEPDAQGDITAVTSDAAASHLAALVARLLADQPVVAVAVAWPMLDGQIDLPETTTRAVILGVGPHLFPAAPAEVVGAFTARPLLPNHGMTFVAVIAVCFAAFSLGFGPLPTAVLAPPRPAALRWVNDGALGSHIGVVVAWALAWTAVASALYLVARRRRPG